MIDIKKLKENAEQRNFTLDENDGMTWSRARIGRLIATILHAANDCQEKCKYCGDRLYVGEAVGTVLNTDPIFMAERPDKVSEYGYLGTLNGVIAVYLAPELEKNECLMGHHGRTAIGEKDFFFLLKYEGQDYTQHFGITEIVQDEEEAGLAAQYEKDGWLTKKLMRFKWFRDWRKRKKHPETWDPTHPGKSDEENVQKIYSKMYEKYKDKVWVATEKLEGQNITIFTEYEDKALGRIDVLRNPSMTRKEFLHCQMCKHCYDHKCRDLTQMTISLCKKHHWPTYDPNCPDWEETDDPNNWAKFEYERKKEDKRK